MQQAKADADRLVTREKNLFDMADKKAQRAIQTATNKNIGDQVTYLL